MSPRVTTQAGHAFRARFALAVVLFLSLAPLPAAGQEAAPDWTGQDYYKRTTDERVAILLDNVERNHMVRQHKDREGAAQFDIGDLKYTLWVFPNHPKALYLIGAIARDMNNPGLALPYFERAIQLFPAYAYTRAQYGEFLVSIGATTVGIQELEASLRMDPNLAVARAWLTDATSGRAKPSARGAVDLAP
jgi:tetratricopeptide (TPR) repeat protein